MEGQGLGARILQVMNLQKLNDIFYTKAKCALMALDKRKSELFVWR